MRYALIVLVVSLAIVGLGWILVLPESRSANEQALRDAQPGDLLVWSTGQGLTQVLVVDSVAREGKRYISATSLTRVSNQRLWDIEEFAATPMRVVSKDTLEYKDVLGRWVPGRF